MKNIVKILIFLIAATNCWAQKDRISLKELTVNGVVLLGEDKSTLSDRFGSPSSIEDFHDEMNDENGKIYIYEGAKFFIQNDLIDSFEVTDQKFELTNHKIRIGDKISTLADVFPDSYLNRKNSGLQLEILEADLYVVISYGSIDGKITKFAIYNY